MDNDNDHARTRSQRALQAQQQRGSESTPAETGQGEIQDGETDGANREENDTEIDEDEEERRLENQLRELKERKLQRRVAVEQQSDTDAERAAVELITDTLQSDEVWAMPLFKRRRVHTRVAQDETMPLIPRQMTDYKPVPKTDPSVLVEKNDSKTPSEKTTSSFPRLLKIFLASLVVGIAFTQLLSYTTPLVSSYFSPCSSLKHDEDYQYRPPTTYSGKKHVTARVCVTTVAPRNVSETEKLGFDELTAADMMVNSAFSKQFDPDLVYYTFGSIGTGTVLRLWVTQVEWPECTCEMKKGCPHLKTAAYEAFKLELKDGNLPGVQCVAARDSLGNEITFAWGTDYSFDLVDDEVLKATCVYDEDKADDVYLVGEGLEVRKREF